MIFGIHAAYFCNVYLRRFSRVHESQVGTHAAITDFAAASRAATSASFRRCAARMQRYSLRAHMPRQQDCIVVAAACLRVNHLAARARLRVACRMWSIAMYLQGSRVK